MTIAAPRLCFLRARFAQLHTPNSPWLPLSQNTELALELGCACLCEACVFPSLSTNLVANAGRGAAEYASYTQHVEWMHKDVVLSLESVEPCINILYKFRYTNR
jgi:hypothetical protein